MKEFKNGVKNGTIAVNKTGAKVAKNSYKGAKDSKKGFIQAKKEGKKAFRKSGKDGKRNYRNGVNGAKTVPAIYNSSK